MFSIFVALLKIALLMQLLYTFHHTEIYLKTALWHNLKNILIQLIYFEIYVSVFCTCGVKNLTFLFVQMPSYLSLCGFIHIYLES